MLENHERVTARSVAKHSGLGAASSITRDPIRRALVYEFREEQQRLEAWARRGDKSSKATMVATAAAKDLKLKEKDRIIQVLVASHLAMLLAIDELGGTGAWIRLYAKYKDGVSLAALQDLGAVPESVQLPDPKPRLRR